MTNFLLIVLFTQIKTIPFTFQTALKIASCFGIKIGMSIVLSLSQSSQYSTLLEDLNQAVKDGFLDSDTDQSCFKFSHDKFREAAYAMIDSDSRDKFHFDIGMLLLDCAAPQLNYQGGIKFTILDQINHGVPALLHDDSQRISIAKLNHEAASESMQCYNYTAAYELSKTAISLLPNDSWSKHYDLSNKFYFLLAKAAYSGRIISEAKVKDFRPVKSSLVAWPYS
jgi:predicted ATPase